MSLIDRLRAEADEQKRAKPPAKDASPFDGQRWESRLPAPPEREPVEPVEPVALRPPEQTRPAPVGRGMPETSRRAAALIAPRAGSHRARLVGRLAEIGEANTYRLALDLGLMPPRAASRMKELRDDGWIEVVRNDDGTPRTAPTAASEGEVYRLTDLGRTAWEKR